MDRISRKDKFIMMSKIDKSLETMESLNDLITLYQVDIQGKLDDLTKDETLQIQLKHELGINW